MAQGYYTLAEAAQILTMNEDELKMIARKGEIRSFQDRGTWRFRVQDIQEMARQRGIGSEPDLVLGESMTPKQKTDSGVPVTEDQPAAFDFNIAVDDEFTDVGKEKLGGGSKSSKRSAPSSKKPRQKTSSLHDLTGPQSPQAGSDSDVRLVGDLKDDFGIEVESDVKLDPPRRSKVKKDKSDSSKKKLAPAEPTAPDSGVRLVPMDSDSDVRIVGSEETDDKVPLGEGKKTSSSDSDIRLDFDEGGSDAEPGAMTEEIDLDEEQQQWEKSAGKAEPASPFELEDSDFELPTTGSVMQSGDDSGSSDFELTPQAEGASSVDSDSSDFDLATADDELSLEDSDDNMSFDLDVNEHASGAKATALASGDMFPDDSSDEHQSLDDSSSEFDLALDEDGGMSDSSSSEFELSLDPEDSSPVDASALNDDSGSSEFELTLDDPDSSSEVAMEDSSSEFELTIDADDGDGPDLSSDSEFELELDGGDLGSDSEFELTLDDDAGLVDSDDDIGTLELDESDETDFFEPELVEDDESASEVVALDDSDLESSDFDIDVDESSSQVVAFEDDMDDFDELVEVGDKPGYDGGVALEEEPDFDEIYSQPGIGVGEPETVYVEKPTAPWGAMPVMVMLPCVVVMLLVGLMSFDLVQSANGYQEPGVITKALQSLMGSDGNRK